MTRAIFKTLNLKTQKVICENGNTETGALYSAKFERTHYAASRALLRIMTHDTILNARLSHLSRDVNMQSKIPEDISFFSKTDAGIQDAFAKKRTETLKPLLRFLSKMNVHPNFISVAGLIGAITAGVLLPVNATYSMYALIFHLLSDGVDGPLARFQNRQSAKGTLIDVFIDHTSLVLMVISAIYASLASAAWLIGYAVSYVSLIAVSISLNLINKPLLFSIRTKYWFYALIYVDVFFNISLLSPLVILSTIYMTAHSIYGIMILAR